MGPQRLLDATPRSCWPLVKTVTKLVKTVAAAAGRADRQRLGRCRPLVKPFAHPVTLVKTVTGQKKTGQTGPQRLLDGLIGNDSLTSLDLAGCGCAGDVALLIQV
jgi:hypothetical protein